MKFISGASIMWIVCWIGVTGLSWIVPSVKVDLWSVTGAWMLVLCWWFFNIMQRSEKDKV